MPALPENTIDQITLLIGEGNARAAVVLLTNTLKELKDPRYQDAILLKNRLRTLEQKVGIGVMSQDDENLELARINKGILDLARLSDEEVSGLKKKRNLKVLIPLGFIVLIIAVLIFQFFIKEVPDSLPPSTILHGQCSLNDEPLSNAFMEFNYGTGTLFDTTDLQGYFKVEVPKEQGHPIHITIRKDGAKLDNRPFTLSAKRLNINL